MTRSGLPARLAAAAGALTAGGVAALAAANAATRSFRLREESVAVLPPGRPELRLLHLSDLHFAPGQDAKAAWLHSLADLEPDLVVNTGDNLSHRHAVEPLIEALNPLMRFPGVYVPGSNCYFAPRLKSPLRYLKRRAPGPDVRDPSDELDWRGMHRAFAGAGWQDASNRAFSMPLAGSRIDVTGVDDPHLGFDRFAGWPVPPKVASHEPALRLALAHAPYRRVLDEFVASDADLILAGHTHGGQVAVPRYGALVSNCDLPTGLAAGLNWWQREGRRAPVDVSAGLGASRTAPYRVACPPEATLLTLTPRSRPR